MRMLTRFIKTKKHGGVVSALLTIAVTLWATSTIGIIWACRSSPPPCNSDIDYCINYSLSGDCPQCASGITGGSVQTILCHYSVGGINRDYPGFESHDCFTANQLGGASIYAVLIRKCTLAGVTKTEDCETSLTLVTPATCNSPEFDMSVTLVCSCS